MTKIKIFAKTRHSGTFQSRNPGSGKAGFFSCAAALQFGSLLQLQCHCPAMLPDA